MLILILVVCSYSLQVGRSGVQFLVRLKDFCISDACPDWRRSQPTFLFSYPYQLSLQIDQITINGSILWYKVFHSASHKLLILKLELYGVKGSILNWLKSYLHNRKQTVVLYFINSLNLLLDWEVVRHGVPQRSVLGPLQFNMYINLQMPNINYN